MLKFMGIDEIVRGDNVLIRTGLKSENLDNRTMFVKDVVGTVVRVNTNHGTVVVDIPNYPQLMIYKMGEVVKLYQEYQE